MKPCTQIVGYNLLARHIL